MNESSAGKAGKTGSSGSTTYDGQGTKTEIIRVRANEQTTESVSQGSKASGIPVAY